MWYYQTKVGTFQIIPNKTMGCFDLWILNEKLGSYRSPLRAARDVHRRETGFDPWDGLEENPPVPLNLKEWHRGRL